MFVSGDEVDVFNVFFPPFTLWNLFLSWSLEAYQRYGKTARSVVEVYLPPATVVCPYSCWAVGPCLLASRFGFSRWQATLRENTFLSLLLSLLCSPDWKCHRKRAVFPWLVYEQDLVSWGSALSWWQVGASVTPVGNNDDVWGLSCSTCKF